MFFINQMDASKMDALKAIKTRRSVRQYEKKEIEEEKLVKIIDCARYAPSAHNGQPWFFFVVRNKEKIKELSKVHKYADFLAEAPVVIVSCALDISQWYVQDTCAAIENILVSAHAEGLGTCWVGVHGKDECEKFIQKTINTKLRVINLIGMGHPNEKPSVRKKSVDEIFKFVD